ncbi:MAG: nucleotidyltransferase family protein [Bacillota bacterium]
MMIPALVLAGAPNAGRLKEVSPAAFEALIDLNGRPLAAHVIEALLATPAVERIVVVGPEALGNAFTSDRILFLPPREGLLENLAAGLDALSAAPRVLVVTSDIPLLTPEAVLDFLELCKDSQVDVFYPVIPREEVEKTFPGVKRTYVRFREGCFTGGNIGLVDPKALGKCLDRAGDFVRLRKKPFRLALVVGPCFLCRFLLGRLSLRQAEKRVCHLLGLRGRVVVSSSSEIGVDVDKPSDLELVKAVLKN